MNYICAALLRTMCCVHQNHHKINKEPLFLPYILALELVMSYVSPSASSIFAVSFHCVQWNKAEMAEKRIFKKKLHSVVE